MNIDRQLFQKIKNQLFKGKVIILYGARRVGKTTLCKNLIQEYGDTAEYFNCDLFVNQRAFGTSDHEKLRTLIGDKKLIILDEAQTIPKIGQTLKILVDTYPEIQVIATGSSSFDLANKTGEPLVGRARTYMMYPLALSEVINELGPIESEAKLNSIFRFGLMPSVFNKYEQESKEELNDITSKYLYKDILEFEQVKNPAILTDLLRALAFQVGNEVSLRELANLLKINPATVARYIDLLEKTFVIFKLRSFSRNLRKELGKSFKIYFWDLGIRNTLIENYNDLELRNDVGAMWENFCIAERLKKNSYERRFVNTYFWRTYDQKEIDYIEESDGVLRTFEFKSGKSKSKIPTEFLETYKNSTFEIINRENYHQFLV